MLGGKTLFHDREYNNEGHKVILTLLSERMKHFSLLDFDYVKVTYLQCKLFEKCKQRPHRDYPDRVLNHADLKTIPWIVLMP